MTLPRQQDFSHSQLMCTGTLMLIIVSAKSEKKKKLYKYYCIQSFRGCSRRHCQSVRAKKTAPCHHISYPHSFIIRYHGPRKFSVPAASLMHMHPSERLPHSSDATASASRMMRALAPAATKPTAATLRLNRSGDPLASGRHFAVCLLVSIARIPFASWSTQQPRGALWSRGNRWNSIQLLFSAADGSSAFARRWRSLQVQRVLTVTSGRSCRVGTATRKDKKKVSGAGVLQCYNHSWDD